MVQAIMEIDRYKDTVSSLADKADGKETVLNRSPEHAAVIISAIFKKSNQYVKIITSDLPDVAYGTADVIQSALGFLGRNDKSRIEIICEKDFDPKGSRLLSAINSNGFLDRVTLFRAPDSVQEVYTVHIVLGDGLHFRVQETREEYSAFAKFGDAERGLRLDDLFKTLKAHSQPLPISLS